jgi:hypothetical protein
MGDNYWARIEIGGKIPTWLVPKLRELLATHFTDWGLDQPFVEGVVFSASDSEARNGRFQDVEEFLVTHRIHYDRQCDHYMEYDGGLVQYRGEDEDPEAYRSEKRVDSDGNFIWGWSEVKSAFEEALVHDGIPDRDDLARDLLGRDIDVDQVLDPILQGMERHLAPEGRGPLEPLDFTDTCNICGEGREECVHLKALIEEDPNFLDSWVASFVSNVIRKALDGYIGEPLSEEDMRAAGVRLLTAWWETQGCTMMPSGHVWAQDKDQRRRDVGRVPLDTVKYDGERLEASFLPALPVGYVSINLDISNKEDTPDG